VIVVHHAGRNGEMRGTSRREDAAFWVIKLEDRLGSHAGQGAGRGAHFVSLFTKPSRNGDGRAYEWEFIENKPTDAWAACARVRSAIIVPGAVQLAIEMQIDQVSQTVGLAPVIKFNSAHPVAVMIKAQTALRGRADLSPPRKDNCWHFNCLPAPK
jgi:hypothetical protein